jgi:hypothetical protein
MKRWVTGCIVIFLILAPIARDLKETKIAVKDNNLFVSWFKEPIEICYIIMRDGTVYKVTQNFENIIFFNVWIMKEHLKKKGYTISDILLMVHNHLKLHRISEGDKAIYYQLKREGFRGIFAIFLQGANTVLLYEEKT